MTSHTVQVDAATTAAVVVNVAYCYASCSCSYYCMILMCWLLQLSYCTDSNLMTATTTDSATVLTVT
jgi:hypothetical protein